MRESRSLHANDMELSRSSLYQSSHPRGLASRLAVAASLLVLISFFITSALLFSSDLTIAKMLESHAHQDRATILRADHRLLFLLPFQLLTVFVTAWIIFGQIQHPGASRVSKGLIGLGEFLGIFLILLFFNYLLGLALPTEWALNAIHLLAR